MLKFANLRTAEHKKEPSSSVDARGVAMYRLIEQLYPICRSITGPGLRETLRILQQQVPMEIQEVPSGTQVLDWHVPLEWSIRDAFIKDADGRRVIDFRESNLHVVNYSVPVRRRIGRAELESHLHSVPEHPDWIPYRTSYYTPQWGFCLRHRQRQQLTEAEYEVCIDSTLNEGSLTYGEICLPGRSPDEVLLTCHVCHPSLCNDNLSAIAVAVELAKHLSTRSRRYTYRVLFIPGTIGAITWLSCNRSRLDRIKHGLVLALLGDSGPLTYKRSRRGCAVIDTAVTHVLRQRNDDFHVDDFSPEGYDERQFCSPGFNLPMGRLTRTPNGMYPEYHTSADNLNLVCAESLFDSWKTCIEVVDVLESNRIYRNTQPFGEPQLGRRGLYNAIGGPNTDTKSLQRAILWVLNFSDGEHALLDVAEKSGIPLATLNEAALRLREKDLLVEVQPAADINLVPNGAAPIKRNGAEDNGQVHDWQEPDAARQAIPAKAASNTSDMQYGRTGHAALAQHTTQHDGTSGNGVTRNSPAIAYQTPVLEALQQKAHRLIPGGCHTYAKGDDQYPESAPPFLVEGHGCHVRDASGNDYIEYGAGLRSVTLGHAFPAVIEAAAAEMHRGINFVRPSTLELVCAEEFLRCVPSAEMVKFGKNGSDATTAAVKVARAATGRDLVAICGEHPFFSVDDWFIGSTAMDAGIPARVKELTVTFRYNDIRSVRRLFESYQGKIACLVLEAATAVEPEPGFLEDVRRLCTENGALLVFDEIITGFRWHLHGAQHVYGITPDLSTFGKALANGFSLSALAGKREFMDLGGIKHSSPRLFLLSTTYGAEGHSLAAGLATMRTYRQQDVVARLYRQGERLRQGVMDAARQHGVHRHFYVIGRPCNLVYVTTDSEGERSQEFRTLFLQEIIRRGVIAPSFVVNYAHDDAAIDRTIEAVSAALEIYARALGEGVDRYLVGQPSKPVFRKFN